MLTFLPAEEDTIMNRLKYGNKQSSNKRKKGRWRREEGWGGGEATETFCKFCCCTPARMQSVPWHSVPQQWNWCRTRMKDQEQQNRDDKDIPMLFFCIVKVNVLPWYNHNGWLGVKHQVTYKVDVSPWYNHNGLTGCKTHTKLLTKWMYMRTVWQRWWRRSRGCQTSPRCPAPAGRQTLKHRHAPCTHRLLRWNLPMASFPLQRNIQQCLPNRTLPPVSPGVPHAPPTQLHIPCLRGL